MRDLSHRIGIDQRPGLNQRSEDQWSQILRSDVIATCDNLDRPIKEQINSPNLIGISVINRSVYRWSVIDDSPIYKASNRERCDFDIAWTRLSYKTWFDEIWSSVYWIFHCFLCILSLTKRSLFRGFVAPTNPSMQTASIINKIDLVLRSLCHKNVL